MDWFGLFLDAFTLAGLGVLHIGFVSRLCERRAGPGLYGGYFVLLFAAEAALRTFSPGPLSAAAAELLVLFAAGRLVLKSPPPSPAWRRCWRSMSRSCPSASSTHWSPCCFSRRWEAPCCTRW